MKALDILNTLRDDYIDCYDRGLAKKDDWKEIDEAILELEALQAKIKELEASKTCDANQKDNK